jgi:hypothetical protein
MKQEMSSPGRRPDISLAQVAASALAAVSAAVVASFLGVGGTVLGAALGSTVATIAGAVYAHTFRQARDKLSETHVLTVVTRARTAREEPGPGDVPVIEPPAPAAASSESGGGDSADGEDNDAANDAAEGAVPAYAESGTPVTAEGEVVPVTDPRRPRWMSWKALLLMAVAAFVVAMVVISVIELTIGRPISGGSGTTVTKLVHHGRTRHPAPSTPTPAPTTAPVPTSTPTTSPTSSTSPTPVPTGTASQTPTGTPTATAPPVPTPTG